MATAALLVPCAVLGLTTATGPAQAQTGEPKAYTDHTPPVVTIRLVSKTRKSLRFDGVRATVILNEPGTFSVVVRDPHARQISAGNTGIASVPEGGAATVSARLTQSAKTKLRHNEKVRWTVVVTALDGVGNRAKRSTKLWVG
ncbi:MAG: hypothetical protein J7513_07315 [Solirubrobacteraceae bacterium]|nr:hypothetical protein [Solirubrobacteraceae bacterium]